jgi:hypothetical protein
MCIPGVPEAPVVSDSNAIGVPGRVFFQKAMGDRCSPENGIPILPNSAAVIAVRSWANGHALSS